MDYPFLAPWGVLGGLESNICQGPPFGVLLWGVCSARPRIIARWLMGGLFAGVHYGHHRFLFWLVIIVHGVPFMITFRMHHV